MTKTSKRVKEVRKEIRTKLDSINKKLVKESEEAKVVSKGETVLEK